MFIRDSVDLFIVGVGGRVHFSIAPAFLYMYLYASHVFGAIKVCKVTSVAGQAVVTIIPMSMCDIFCESFFPPLKVTHYADAL